MHLNPARLHLSSRPFSLVGWLLCAASLYVYGFVWSANHFPTAFNLAGAPEVLFRIAITTALFAPLWACAFLVRSFASARKRRWPSVADLLAFVVLVALISFYFRLALQD